MNTELEKAKEIEEHVVFHFRGMEGMIWSALMDAIYRLPANEREATIRDMEKIRAAIDARSKRETDALSPTSAR